MAKGPSVRWNEGAQRWMAWVRFPDGSRRKVERVSKKDAQADLSALLAARAAGDDVASRRERLASFDDVIDAWLAAGCPSTGVAGRTRHAKTKSPNTISNARSLLDAHVRPSIGKLRVERTA